MVLTIFEYLEGNNAPCSSSSADANAPPINPAVIVTPSPVDGTCAVPDCTTTSGPISANISSGNSVFDTTVGRLGSITTPEITVQSPVPDVSIVGPVIPEVTGSNPVIALIQQLHANEQALTINSKLNFIYNLHLF